MLVSTYQRTANLRRSLESIALQEGMDGKFEVVITDDGSTDDTSKIVNQFANSVSFPVTFTTHPHNGFQLSLCRNEGVTASSAPYIVFLDGDCAIPPDHLLQHWNRRETGTVRSSQCCWLEKETSERVDLDAIRSGEFLKWGSSSEKKRLRIAAIKAHFYSFIRHPKKPKLLGANFGIWRSDYEKVNGYDQGFKGWGCEDDDLRGRLHQAGVRVKTILPHTKAFHLWHPPTATRPDKWKEGANVSRFHRKYRLTKCLQGLTNRPLSDVKVRLANSHSIPQPANQLLSQSGIQTSNHDRPEIECLVAPANEGFSGRAECNLLLLTEHSNAPSPVPNDAHIIVSDQPVANLNGRPQLNTNEFAEALQALV